MLRLETTGIRKGWQSSTTFADTTGEGIQSQLNKIEKYVATGCLQNPQ